MTRQEKFTAMLLVAAIYAAALGCLLFFTVPAANKDLVLMMLSPLAAAFGYIAGKPTAPDKPTDPAKPKE